MSGGGQEGSPRVMAENSKQRTEQKSCFST